MATSTAIPSAAPQHLIEAHRLAAEKRDAVSTRVETLNDQIAEAEKQTDLLSAHYTEACRLLAQGQKADPGAIAGQLDMVRMRLGGLRSLHGDALAEHAPLVAAANEAWVAVRTAEQNARIAELTANLENRTRAFEAAKAAAEAAYIDMHTSVGELSEYRHQVTLAQERRARGLEL